MPKHIGPHHPDVLATRPRFFGDFEEWSLGSGKTLQSVRPTPARHAADFASTHGTHVLSYLGYLEQMDGRKSRFLDFENPWLAERAVAREIYNRTLYALADAHGTTVRTVVARNFVPEDLVLSEPVDPMAAPPVRNQSPFPLVPACADPAAGSAFGL